MPEFHFQCCQFNKQFCVYFYVYAIGFGIQAKVVVYMSILFNSLVETFEQKNVLCFDKQLSVDCKHIRKCSF